MDLIALWKVIAIVTTGAFGTLGVVTETKDKTSGRLTRWGLISIVGIVATTTLGAIAQYYEGNNDAAAARKLAQTTNDIATGTQDAVKGIQGAISREETGLQEIHRMFNQLSPGRVRLTYTASCHDVAWKNTCLALRKETHPIESFGLQWSNTMPLASVPPSDGILHDYLAPIGIAINLDTPASEGKATQHFLEALYDVTIDPRREPKAIAVSMQPGGKLFVEISGTMNALSANGTVAIDDLRHMRIFVSSDAPLFDTMQFNSFVILAPNGTQKIIDSRDFDDDDPVKGTDVWMSLKTPLGYAGLEFRYAFYLND